MKKTSIDKTITGLISGFLLPLVAFFIIYLLMDPGGTLHGFIVKADKADALTKFMSLAMLPNLLLFFIFIWTKCDRAARGVLAATIILALAVVFVKFVL